MAAINSNTSEPSEGMGSRPESTATFHRELDAAAAECAAVESNLKAHLRAVDDADTAMQRELSDQRRVDAHLDAERADFALDYEGCLLDGLVEERAMDTADPWQMQPEAILARKTRKGKVYYRVLWKRVMVVSWELEENVDDKNLIFAFEKAYKAIYAPETSKRLPAKYVSRRKVATTAKLFPGREDARYRGIWSCEVEPMIWVPYDEGIQAELERQYTNGAPVAEITMMGDRKYNVDFSTMKQKALSGPGAARAVQRVAQVPEAEERARLDRMSLDELRRYIGSLTDFQPIHYEALSRLHEMDKVVNHASPATLEKALHKTTFEKVMNQIVEGAEFPGFTGECFVCLEDYSAADEMAVLPCGHSCHYSCALDYFKQYSNLCPVCKAPIS